MFKAIISTLIRFVPRKYLQLVSGFALKLSGWFLKGEGVQCPICKNEYKYFLPYGRLRVRSNALCPGCLSLERHRLIQKYLVERTDFYSRRLDVLHLAPERCFVDLFRKAHGSGYVTADMESPWADVKLDVHQMPFLSEKFDVVLCNHVLEHVDNDLKAMAEIARVLKKGGWAILQVPFFSPVPEKIFEDPSVTDDRMREKLFGQSDHIRRYGKDYGKRIQSCGLEVHEEKFSFDLNRETCNQFGLIPEIIFIGIKK